MKNLNKHISNVNIGNTDTSYFVLNLGKQRYDSASLPMNVVMLQFRQSGTYYIDNYSVTKVSGSLIMDFGNFEIGAYASNTVMDYYDDWYNRANLPIAITQGNWMNRIRVNYGDPYDCLRKVISVTPNQQYTFRGKIVGAQNGNVRVMQMSSSTPSSMSLVTYQLISTNDGYVEFSFTPTKNQVQITVNGVDTYYLEDVAVFKTITQKKYTPTTHEKVLPTFTNVQNMTQTGATVQSTSGSGAKGGESVQQINKGDYVQFEIGSDALSNYYSTSVGISYTPSGKNIEMDFSWYLGLPAMTRDVLVAGVYKPNLNNPRLFQNGDVYRIWRNNGNVEFYVNGLLDGTFPDKYPDRPMYLEAVFYDVNKKVENLYIYKEVLKTHDTIQSTEMVAKVDGYKRGFNGQERVDEVSGKGNSYTAEFWQYSPRLGKRWNLDPKPNISISPYATFGNNPTMFSDPYGDIFKIGTKDEQARKDVQSLTRYKKNKKYIKIDDESGEVSLDFGSLSKEKAEKIISKDAHLRLIRNLSTAKNEDGKDLNFFYGTEGETGIGLENPEKQKNVPDYYSDISSMSNKHKHTDEYGGYDPRAFVLSASTQQYSSSTKYGLKPIDGYDGKVFIGRGTFSKFEWDSKEGKDVLRTVPRFLILYHELNENFLRTVKGSCYEAAHEAAGGANEVDRFFLDNKKTKKK